MWFRGQHSLWSANKKNRRIRSTNFMMDKWLSLQYVIFSIYCGCLLITQCPHLYWIILKYLLFGPLSQQTAVLFTAGNEQTKQRWIIWANDVRDEVSVICYVPNTYHIMNGMPEIEYGDDDDGNIYKSSSRLATTITVLMWKCVRGIAHCTEIQFRTFIRQSRTILNVSSVSNSFDKIQFAARFNCLFTLLIRV